MLLFGLCINIYRWDYIIRKQLTYYPNTLLQGNFIIADTFALNLYGRPFCKLNGNITKTLHFILTDVLNIHLECDEPLIDCCASSTLNQCSWIFIHSVVHVALSFSLVLWWESKTLDDCDQNTFLSTFFPSYRDTLVNSPLQRCFLMVHIL